MSKLTLLSINPIAFKVFGWSVYWYGLLIGVGMVLAYILVMRETKRKGLSEDKMSDALFWTIIFGIVGARLYYVVFRWDYYRQHLGEIVKMWEGGGAIYGSILLGGATLFYLSKRYTIDTYLTLDIAAPAVMLAQVIGRWGNFINQEAYGVEVTRDVLASWHLPNWVIEQMHIAGIYRQPTFLMESCWNLIGFILILILRRVPNVLRKGEVLALYVGWYGLGRFVIEEFRSDSLYFASIKISQLVSVAMMLVSIVMLIMGRMRHHVMYTSLDNTHTTSVGEEF